MFCGCRTPIFYPPIGFFAPACEKWVSRTLRPGGLSSGSFGLSVFGAPRGSRPIMKMDSRLQGDIRSSIFPCLPISLLPSSRNKFDFFAVAQKMARNFSFHAQGDLQFVLKMFQIPSVFAWVPQGGSSGFATKTEEGGFCPLPGTGKTK